MHSKNRLIAISFATLLISTSAFAQTFLPDNSQGSVSVPNMGQINKAPPPAASAIPAPPNGAFETQVPTVGAGDVANTMTLSGGDGYVQNMVESSDTRLRGLISNPVSGETASLLERMRNIKQSNMLLELKAEEAELAIGLWGVLFNNEHAQAWRQRQDAERRESREAEEKARADAAARQSSTAVTNAQAAISQRAMPVVYEISNGEAVILVPGGGEVYARAGTQLPNGMRVISVGNSVIVEDDGINKTLGFGVTTGSSPSATN